MPSNPTATDGQGDSTSLTDTTVKGRGRTRYCKKCKFTCTDAREFTAHQSTHSESSDNSKDFTSEDTESSTSNISSTSKRVLRPKRSSKGSISETSLSGSMESVDDKSKENSSMMEEEKNMDETVASEADPQTDNINKTDLDGEESKDNVTLESENTPVERAEEAMDDEGDEPDAMVPAASQKDITTVLEGKTDSKKLPSEVDNFSGNEDMDEEGKLVIDDDSLSKLPASLSNSQSKTYSCRQCEMTTTSAKSYLRHLSDEHNLEASIYECDMCDYATIYKHKLPGHRRLHFSSGFGEEGEGDSFIASFNNKDTVVKNEPVSSTHDNFLNVPCPKSSPHIFFNVDNSDDVKMAPAIPPVEQMSSSVPLTITTENIDQVFDDDKKKKKKTRQEVDPGKYFEAVDIGGTKYACSQCGNIYKWRKSLNKHWKEKHSLDPLVEEASPPGMLELLKSGKYTQLGARRIYEKVFLSTIKTQKDDDAPHSSVSPRGNSPSPPNFYSTQHNLAASRLASTMMPKMIGPFVASTAQPVFPGMPMAMSHLPMHNGYESPDEGALDLTRDSKPESRNSPYSVMNGQDFNSSFDQDQPLDFSKKGHDKPSKQKRNDKLWEDMESMKPANNINQYIPKVHRCSKCDYTSRSEVEFANHTSSHLNKRIVKCYECKQQINSMDELNNHFLNHHHQKLTEYKEAIKKIPHGLQQTYHLLKMDLQDIGELGNQDLGASEAKSLKCKKCDFEAKWPAELQKHAVSHSEERPYICMVCGSTYKWKWDLVKHFQKSHPNLPNPYRRKDNKESPDDDDDDDDSSGDDGDGEPVNKRSRREANNENGNVSIYNRDDAISVEGIIAATQAGQRVVSSQPNILDDEPTPNLDAMDRNLAFLNFSQYQGNGDIPQVDQMAQATQEIIERHRRAQRAQQDAIRNRPSTSNGSSSSGSSSSNPKKRPHQAAASPNQAGTSRAEDLPYKCTMCNYHARWPSEVTQHMKNHSDSKPYLCPRCEYRSKWKWDVVKHLKRCGGGGVNDVIDTTKNKRKDGSTSNGPPNAVVSQQGRIKKTTPQPPLAYIVPSIDENGQQSAMVVRPSATATSTASSSGDDMSRPGSSASFNDYGSSASTYNENTMTESVANMIAAFSSSQSYAHLNPSAPMTSTSFVPIAPSSVTRNSPALSPASQGGNTRQSSSAEVWNCPHCPFTTMSQAELKRHSGLHSDDKPFKCDICQYSTRWACDLKKHRRSYNHYPKQNTGREVKEKENPQSRFKCSTCKIFFQSLHSLLEHRKSEHIGRDSAQSSPTPLTQQNEIDAARIKHPRKPIRQIQCPKCSFVCKNRNTMDIHIEEHEQLEMNGIHCFYCSSQFMDKESLLDHITSHSAFNPEEWETFFMINEEEEQQHYQKEGVKAKDADTVQAASDDKEIHSSTSSQQENEKAMATSTEARIQQILSEVPKQSAFPQQSPSTNKYKCEWCPAEFVNLSALYSHASQTHPVQLKAQDVSMAVAPPKSQQNSGKKMYTGEPIDILRQQIAEKRNQQIVEKFSEMLTQNPKMQEVLSKKLDEDKTSKRYNCDKCTFSSSNPTTFQRHYDLHGSKLTSQCWFCDYSVDRMNLLYQHMKISHTRKWKALSQDPKYASQIHKMNLAFANTASNGNNNASPPEDVEKESGAMDLSSKTKSPEVAHDIMYMTKQQYTWSGIPVNVIPVGNTLNFVCPHCSFSDTSIAQTCHHVMQSHRAMSKFTCKKCQFSDDNIHVMSDHCKTSHPVHERVVEVLEFKQVNFLDLQMVQMSALRERISQDLSKASSDEQPLPPKAMSCPFCPFKTVVTENMKEHVSNHSKQARYRCQFCDFSTDCTTTISDHVKVHDANYTIEDRSTTEQPALKVKEETMDMKVNDQDAKMDHSDESPIQNYSDKESSPKSKPSGRIRYRCSVCPYHTTCKSNILKHKRQHLHSKRYKCSKCSYSAARAVLLKNHLDAHDSPVEEDGQYHDIFCNPNSPSDDLKSDENDEHENEEVEMDTDDLEDEDTNSDDLDEMDAKAIADLEAKDILEAEAAHKASILLDEDATNGESADKQFRKQRCPHCPFSSNSGYEFRKHLNFHGTQERYKCDRCSYSLDRLNLLSQHRKLHADEPGFNPNPTASDLLNTKFILQQSSSQLEETTKEESDQLNSDAQQHSCPSCPYKAPKQKSLEIHFNSHGMKKRYICDFCDWSADRLGLLYQHRKVHENESHYDPSPEDKIFLNQEFDDGASAGEFEAKLTNVDKSVKEGETDLTSSPPFKLTVVKKSYPCNSCPYKTNSKSSYSAHKAMHGSSTDFPCSECSYAAVNMGLLKQHMNLHSSKALDLASPTSSKRNSFNDAENTESTNLYQELMSLGSNNKDFKSLSNVPVISELKCQRCPFTATSQNILNEHARGHLAQDSLQCPYCDFSATSKKSMFSHIQIHFPGTKLEPEAMERMLEEHAKATNNNQNNDNSPISTETSQSQPEKEAVKTKRVYVCQYCEREFEGKDLMIQHEKQHLVGSH